jgi:hypothetical protein
MNQDILAPLIVDGLKSRLDLLLILDIAGNKKG